MTTKSAPKKVTPTAGSKTDAIKLLTADHTEVHALFRKYSALCESGADGEERQPLAEQICLLLTVHVAIEEEIFYPEAREAGIDDALLNEADVELASVKDLIAQIRGMEPDDDLYDAKVTVLGEFVEHHVKDEREEMFPKCVKSAMDLKAIGAQMATRKAELTAEMTEGMDLVQ